MCDQAYLLTKGISTRFFTVNTHWLYSFWHHVGMSLYFHAHVGVKMFAFSTFFNQIAFIDLRYWHIYGDPGHNVNLNGIFYSEPIVNFIYLFILYYLSRATTTMDIYLRYIVKKWHWNHIAYTHIYLWLFGLEQKCTEYGCG